MVLCSTVASASKCYSGYHSLAPNHHNIIYYTCTVWWRIKAYSKSFEIRTLIYTNQRDLNIYGCLMQHDSIAESSYGSFLQYNHTAFSNQLSTTPWYMYILLFSLQRYYCSDRKYTCPLYWRSANHTWFYNNNNNNKWSHPSQVNIS